MNANVHLKHWKTHTDEAGLLWAGFDKADAKANTWDKETLSELSALCDHIDSSHNLHGVIFYSCKPSGFIAGADIHQFTQLPDEAAALALIERGQQVFDQVAALKVHTVAMISGFCLGGGLEFALACDYRVAEDSDKTKIGLPEVNLGIHPGWGGTVRLPELIGPLKALPMILSGRAMSARQAFRSGVVDAAVPLRQLRRAATHMAIRTPRKQGQPDWQRILFALQPARKLAALMMERQLKKRIAKENYPAPFTALENWVKVGLGSRAQKQEAHSITKLFFHPTTANLIRLFFLQEKLKGLGKGVDFKPAWIHVMGAGIMGRGIATYLVSRGYKVTLQDREPKYLGPAFKEGFALLHKKIKNKSQVTQIMDNLIPDPKGEGIKHADVIVEAIYEDLSAKQELYQYIEKVAKPECLIATNTSGIPLDQLNRVFERPERLVGIHFFNPVAKMQLVEVVQGEKTSEDAMKFAMAFVGGMGKLPVPVKSHPGFLVNRILMPYLMEAVALVEEGVSKTVIDNAAKTFGMPMGPVELADTVGLDVCLHVMKYLSDTTGVQTPKVLETLVSEGHLGRKTGKGFYTYKNGQRQNAVMSKTASAPEYLTERLIFPMILESLACLKEGVVENEDLLDAAMVLGTGFAPFRGGPMAYARTLGRATLEKNLVALISACGERFDRASLLTVLFSDEAGKSSASTQVEAMVTPMTKDERKAILPQS